MKRILWGAFVVAGFALTGSASAQSTWPSHGPWQVQAKQANSGMMCVLGGIGQIPHNFGILVMVGRGSAFFGLDDRTPGISYRPEMIVNVDGAMALTADTFNDPPMTMTTAKDADRVRRLVPRIGQGRTLSVQARGLEYQIDLTGFAAASEDLKACEAQI